MYRNIIFYLYIYLLSVLRIFLLHKLLFWKKIFVPYYLTRLAAFYA